MANLDRVLWIGGSPCAGKTSVAAALAQRFRLGRYHLDDHTQAHLDRADGSSPALVGARDLDWNELWSRPVSTLVREEFSFYAQEFPFIVGDLTSLDHPESVVAEGTGMIPELVAPLLTSAAQAIWLVPTPEFQLRHYRQRDWLPSVLDQCEDPHRAFDRWMGRDMEFGSVIERQARNLGLAVITVDGSVPLRAIVDDVERHFRATGLLPERRA